MYSKGVIGSVTGTDIVKASLDEATMHAVALSMPARYVKVDINNDPLPSDKFDFVVNHAALHHVARIDFVLRSICHTLPESGMFASFDYTGSHPNQYEYEMWSKVVEFNAAKPEHLRHPNLAYPHMRTMLHLDPSEAIHSELIVKHIKRYFIVEHAFALGGRFAYLLMHNHSKLNEHKDTAEGKYLVDEILKIDQDLTNNDLDRSMFTFFMLRPNKAVLKNELLLQQWTLEEEERETLAAANEGRYYPKTALEIIYEK
jgi:SAM-dependent methyltransferase